MSTEVFMEVGGTYRLKLDQEIRDEQSGTMREFIHKGTIVKVAKLAADENRIWLQGYRNPLDYAALRRRVTRA